MHSISGEASGLFPKKDRRRLQLGKPLPLVDAPPAERSDAAENRRLLLSVANRIIQRDGIEALSMDRLAAEAQLGVGTVYRRFGNLSSLLHSLLDDDEKRFQTAFLFGPPPLGPGAPPAERLRAFLHAYVARLDRTARLLAVTQTHPAAYSSAPFLALRIHLIALLEEGDPSLDPQFVADALMAAMGARLYLHQRAELGYSEERILQGLDQLVDRLLPPRS